MNENKKEEIMTEILTHLMNIKRKQGVEYKGTIYIPVGELAIQIDKIMEEKKENGNNNKHETT